MIKSLLSAGDAKPESTGVAGKDDRTVDGGPVGSLVGGTMGRVRESRLLLRDAFDVEREERPLSTPGAAENRAVDSMSLSIAIVWVVSVVSAACLESWLGGRSSEETTSGRDICSPGGGLVQGVEGDDFLADERRRTCAIVAVLSIARRSGERDEEEERSGNKACRK